MESHEVALVVAALLCAMAAGLLFAFAAVVMPGLKRLDDRQFIRSFQAIDGVVQDGQPVFGLVIGGSAIALLVATGVSVGQVDGADRWLLIVAAVAYVAAAIVPTIAVNLQLNNRIQTYDVEVLDAPSLERVRREFERRWNVWNIVRTVVASATAALLIVVLARL